MRARRARRGSGVALFALMVVLLGACRLELGVDIGMEEDGSGTVEVVVGLDEDAVERVGGDLEDVLEVDDLVAAGWAIDGPTLEDDGFTRLRISHRFASPEEANDLLGQVAGADGPFQDLEVARTDATRETVWAFTGRLDFAGGLQAFGDEGVAAELDGEPLGQSVEEIEAQLGEPIGRMVRVQVGVRLPGEVTSNAPSTDDGLAVWSAQFGDAPLDLVAHGEEQHTAVLIAAGVAVAALLALLVYALVRLVLRLTHRSRTRA